MLSSRVLRKSVLTFPIVARSGFFLGLCSLLAFDAESSHTPLPFACEVRYHFREHFRYAKPGQKSVSAPSFSREALPMSRVAISEGAVERIVEGRVAHLPYHFSVKICRARNSEAETLKINVLDSSGKSVTGFPRVLSNPLTKTGDSSRKTFELPVEKAVKKWIKKTLLAQEQLLTHVDSIVGMDEEFLSAEFPKSD